MTLRFVLLIITTIFTLRVNAQEIKVTGNSTEIVDGDAYPDFSDDTYFAGADVSSGTVRKTFTIENTGSTTLTLSGSSPYVSVSGTNSADFSITSAPSNSISGSSSTTFTIEFDPSAAGPREAEITITSNDADEGTYNFTISGIGIGVISAASPLGSTGAQIGLDIDGEASNDYSGTSVSLSSDGTIMAIGAHGYDGIGSNSGYVRVFKFSGDSWSQLGGDLEGEARGDESGYSISISGNGTVLAIGARINDGGVTKAGHVRVFYYDGSSWNQLGSDIDGESNYDYSGYSVSLSSDGTIIAIGAPTNDGNGGNSGHVRVYKYSGSSWGQLGGDINGEASGDESGTSISLNSDGTILAIGAPYNSGNGSNSGHVRVYQYSSSSWSQLGGDIDGEASGDESGRSVSLSSDGTLLAIGATENNENGSGSGHVRVYKYSGNSWSQLGSDIDGEASGDESGSSVSLSSDGTVLAIGAKLNDGNGSNSGHLRLYQYSSSSWTQLGSDIDGESSSDNSGSSVCLSSNASVLAIGAPYANSVGQVRTYALNDPEITITGNNLEIENGDVKIKTANNTYYGEVNPITTGTINKAFTIKNTGVVDLTLNGSPLVSISGNHASGFTVSTQPSSSTIAAGDSTTFIIAFNPDTSGIKSATVSIGSNDANENTFEFSIEGYSSTIPSDTLIQLHGDIDGEKAGDESGRSVSINADGRIVAIGAINNDGNGTNSGHVRVFQNTGTSWSQIGSDIDGESAGDHCGISVALSSDGTRLAIGARYNDGNGSSSGHVRVYELNRGLWSQLGSDINGEAAGDRSGYSVAMNADGDRVAIGAVQNDGNGSNAGHVRIFEYSSSTTSWSQLGGDIDGETADDQSGRVVSMSADGNRVAIGTYKNDGNGTNAGHVRIFEYNSSTSSWSQLGADIDGEASGDQSGTSVAMNEDGSRVVIGAPYNDGNGTDAGYVRIYEYNSGSSSWSQLGADIDGEVANDQSGQSVSMSLDGKRIAISAMYNDDGGANRGHVRFFDFDQEAESWNQIGNDVYGEADWDFSGYAISMSGDGAYVAIGALQNAGNGTDAGHVRIFSFKDTNATCIVNGNANIANGDETPSVDEGTDFGEAVVSSSTSSVSKFFSIKNSGVVKNLTLSGASPFVTIGGTNSADFTIETAPSSSIGPASSTYFELKFAPSAVGTRTATVTITSNDANASPYTFDISGEGIAPEIKISGNSTEIVNGDVSPSTADHTDFEDVLVSSGTVSKTFTIENTGVGDLDIDDWPSLVNISGTNSADFSVSSTPSNSISASSSTTFTIEFNPSDEGTRTATLTINSNDSDEGTYTFDIEGEGVSPEIKISGNNTEIVDGDNTPSITDHTNFGSTTVSSGTVSNTFTIENTGSSTLTLSGSSPYVSISGNNSGDFSVTSTPSNSIATSSSTSFTIEFDPSATGTRTATISISSDDTDESPYTFDIEGEGIEPEIEISGNSTEIVDGDATPSLADYTDFGSTTVSVGTVSRTFIINNSGTGALTLSGSSPYVSISGTNSGDFSVTSNPSNSISAGSSTTFTIEFDPSAEGTRSATLTISNNDADEGTYNFDIEGEGVEPEIKISGNSTEIADGDAMPSSDDYTDFGSVNVTGGVHYKTFTIENTGTESLSITGSTKVAISGTNSADFTVSTEPSNSISAGGSSAFTIKFNPSASGSRTATVSIANNDDDENPYNFSIQGTGAILPTDLLTQLGSDIDGEAANDRNGYSVSMNANGTRMAVGARLNNGGSKNNNGHVRVYEYSGNSWSQLGSDIDGEAANDESGFSVSISADGKRVAIGAPLNDDNGTDAGHVRIYEYNSSSWSQLGADINGEFSGDQSGYSVDINSDGSRVAIGARYNDGGGSDAGQVRIYEYNSSTGSWSQLGSDIDGASAGDQSGNSVTISADGNRVAIGARYNDDNGTNSGHVRIYEYNSSSSSWSQLGSDIDGESSADESGFSVSMSSDGSLVAIGARKNGGNGTNSGHVRVYEYENASSGWSQVGSDINGEASGDESGWSVALSSDGSRVAIGARNNDGSGSNAGHVRVYEYSGSSWRQLASDLDGEAAADNNGWSVAICADGGRVAVGANLNDGNGNGAGHVRIFEFEDFNPEIKISGNSTEIVDGDDTPNTADHTDFESALVSSGTVSKTYTIENTGTGTLTLSGSSPYVSVSGTNSTDFSVTSTPNNSISSGSSTTFTVTFNPSATGTRTATISVNSDDDDESNYNFDVKGEGIEPEIKISGNGVEIADNDATPRIKDHTYFGSVDATSATKTRTFTIENTGTGDLTLSSNPIVSISGTNSSDFTVATQPSAFAIAANGSLTFVIEFNPGAEGDRVAEISLASNDADEATYNFSISGLGSSKADYPFDWTWYGGSSIKDQSGTYGTKGTASGSNIPGGRRNAFTWKDANGIVYLFGGYGLDENGDEGYLNDFWKFDGANWTWLSGDDTRNSNGTYGTMGTASSSNTPGARFGHVGYVDGSGNVWLFGGQGYYGSSTSTGNLNDIWKWDGSNWTWVGGDNDINKKSDYGTTGQYSSSSWPRGAHESVHWYDANGIFWILGGYGRDKNNQGGQLNDLWKWNGSQWAFVGGSKTRKPAGSYGTKGTASSSNWPGGRRYGAAWVDASNNLWLFGGNGQDKTTNDGYLNDLWKYDVSTGYWTWVEGDDDRNQNGSYGTQGKAASSNVPGSRRRCSYWLDGSGNMTIYGGIGYDANGNLGALNDMWVWNGSKWAWTSGEKTYEKAGNYGTQGTSSSDEFPGAKYAGANWIDDKGNLWTLGGYGIDGSGNEGYLNDLWQMEMAYIWNGTSSTWTTNGNWKHGGVANSNYPVKIPSGLSTYPTISSDISLSDIEIEDGASFSISSGNTVTITNSFEYSGSSALSLGDGTLKFNGSSAQTIDGKISGNVEIDNSNDVSLGAESIISSLTLTNGDLDIGNNNLTLGSATGGSSSSYIKISGTGKVTAEVGSSPVTLPIGRNPYEPIIIDDGGGNDYTVGVYESVYENPVTQTNQQTSNVVGETWTIQPSGSQSNVSVTVQWNSSEEETGFARTNASLSYWENGVSSAWNIGAGTSASGSGPFTLTRTVNFSTNLFYFGVGSAGSALPVDFTFFTAQWDTEGESALLNWQTAMEENNSHFEIQRSFDGLTWEQVGEVQGQGSTFETTNYQFIDQLETPAPRNSGRNSKLETQVYYRLKQIDYNGDFDYSSIQTLDMETAILDLFVFPNPAFGNVINTSETGDYTIYSADGRVLESHTNTSVIYIGELKQGSYIIRNTKGQSAMFIRN
ncbi:MAG: choice-of-anchor D domain-containing protein [Bacteroidia bacterium]